MQLNPPKEILIGYSYAPNIFTYHFDDMNELKNHQLPHKISSIVTYFNDGHILGMKFIYKCGPDNHEVRGESTTRIKPLKLAFTPIKKEKFIISDDDFLMEIFGFNDTKINQIIFTTWRGKKMTIGQQKGTYFKHVFSDQTFCAAKGAYDKFLKYLGLQVIKCPDLFIQQQVNICNLTLEPNIED